MAARAAVFLLALSCPFLAFAQTANLVLLTNATREGAVCLDGSPPGFYLKLGERKTLPSVVFPSVYQYEL